MQSITKNRKIYTENNNIVKNLVDQESFMKRLEIDSPVQVKLSIDGKKIQIIYKGVILNGDVQRPLIHQLGGRAWGNNQDYKLVNKIWHEKFLRNCADLECELEDVFNNYELLIRYEVDGTGKNNIYGITTSHFIDVNQVDFRTQFIEQARQSTALIPISRGIEVGKFGGVTEFFGFDSKGYQTEYEYGLVYAKNNGYEAYRANWGRMIIICTNGLRQWDGGNKYTWKHTKDVDLSEFIAKTVEDGVGNQRFIEDRITASRDAKLNKDIIGELMSRLSLAQASKNRVFNRISVDSRIVGENEWALSQSLTWLGSHETAIPLRNRQQLIGLGTDVLEHSLNNVLSEDSKLFFDGSHGLVLPKNL